MWTEEREEQLVTLVEERPCLFAVADQMYTKRRVKTESWREISETMGVSERELRKKWDSLRTQFTRYRKMRSSEQKTCRQKRVLRRLRFLEPHTRSKPATPTLAIATQPTTAPSDAGAVAGSESRCHDDEKDSKEELILWGGSVSSPDLDHKEPTPIAGFESSYHENDYKEEEEESEEEEEEEEEEELESKTLMRTIRKLLEKELKKKKKEEEESEEEEEEEEIESKTLMRTIRKLLEKELKNKKKEEEEESEEEEEEEEIESKTLMRTIRKLLEKELKNKKKEEEESEEEEEEEEIESKTLMRTIRKLLEKELKKKEKEEEEEDYVCTIVGGGGGGGGGRRRRGGRGGEEEEEEEEEEDYVCTIVKGLERKMRSMPPHLLLEFENILQNTAFTFCNKHNVIPH